MNIFSEISMKIIKEQELIIGPLAWSEARKVEGLRVVDEHQGQVSIESGDNKAVIDRLVSQYERLFGRASQEVCKEAAAELLKGLAPDQIPTSLLA